MEALLYFLILLAVPPARPSNCKLDNLTSGALASEAPADVTEVHDNGIVVHCQAGFDGGLPQTFLLEVRRQDNSGLVANQSVTSRPSFRIDGLPPDTLVYLDIFAVNAKGRSIAVRLKMRTKKIHQADVKYSFSAGKLWAKGQHHKKKASNTVMNLCQHCASCTHRQSFSKDTFYYLEDE